MYFKEGRIYFNAVFVLESLTPEDIRTGSELYFDIVRWGCQRQGNYCELFSISNRAELVRALTSIDTACRRHKYYPFIHLEAHGNDAGIVLSSGEQVPWRELVPILTQINANCANNLFVSVAACSGGTIQNSVEISAPCPFRGFIGPMQVFYPTDVRANFTAFFDTLFTTSSFDQAIEALNRSNVNKIIYHYWNAESFFETIKRKKLAHVLKDPNYKERLVKLISKDFWYHRPKARDRFRTKGRLRKFIRRRLREEDLHESIELCRSIFLHQSNQELQTMNNAVPNLPYIP